MGINSAAYTNEPARGTDGIAYFVSQLSDNIGRTMPIKRDGRKVPGYLVARSVPVARTGWQRYQVKDLPQKKAESLGIDLSNPDAFIDLYRPAAEVFSRDTMASFEGMPLTSDHPPDFVAPDNWRRYAQGHSQNLRKGKEPLESGDWPLLADLVINVDPLMSDVESDAKREVSCGYTFDIRRDGDLIIQCNMRGNHIAVVPQGRAGHEVRINDSAILVPVLSSPRPSVKRKALHVALDAVLDQVYERADKSANLADSNTPVRASKRPEDPPMYITPEGMIISEDYAVWRLHGQNVRDRRKARGE